MIFHEPLKLCSSPSDEPVDLDLALNLHFFHVPFAHQDDANAAGGFRAWGSRGLRIRSALFAL